MAYRKKNRNVGIVGIGETKFSSHREDVNQPEMIHEAVRQALDDAGLTINDVDCVVHGNMELFEMVHQPDMWHTLGSGAFGKDLVPPHHRRHHRRHPGLRRGQPGGLGHVRRGHGHRV